MKFRHFLTVCLTAGSLMASAQTHKEGIEYYKAEQYNNAQELLERNFNNQGTDKALSNYYLGRIAFDRGDLAAAKKYFETGIAANPECGFNYVGLGAVELKNGNNKVAENHFKDAEKVAKKNPELAIDIARAYYDADPVAYAKEIAKYDEKARRYDMTDPSIYLFEGDMKKDAHDAGGAAGLYEMAANYDNQSAAAYVKYAKLFKDVNPQFGVRKLEELVRVNPTSALGQRELANAYYTLGDYAKAATEYGKYVQNPNRFKEDENQYAFLLFYNSEYKKGYDYATAILAENPSDFSALRYQFMNAANIQNFDGNLLTMAENLYKGHMADKEANKLAQIDYNLIIQELNSAERFDEAEQVAREAVAEFPNVPNYKATLARTLVLQEKYQESADAINEAIAAVENPSFAFLNQGALFNNYAGVMLAKGCPENCSMSQKYLDKSKEHAKRALDAEKSVRTYKLNGDMNKPLSADETVNNAVPYYEEAIALFEANPTDADKRAARDSYLYLAGNILDDDKAKALELYQKALNLDPENANIQQIINSIK